MARPVEEARLWDLAWQGNLAAFEASGNPQDLIPATLRTPGRMRVNGEYVEGADAWYEYSQAMVFKRQMWHRFIPADIQYIYDVGCGPGYNAWALALMFPKTQIIGLDCSESAVSLMNLIGERLAVSVSGRHFDMLEPQGVIERGSALFTSGAMEQLGDEWLPFYLWMRRQEPAVVLHSEPVLELYDATPFDQLAANHHRSKHYLEGYLPFLQAQEDVRLLHVERKRFGSRWHDAYSQIVWSRA